MKKKTPLKVLLIYVLSMCILWFYHLTVKDYVSNVVKVWNKENRKSESLRFHILQENDTRNGFPLHGKKMAHLCDLSIQRNDSSKMNLSLTNAGFLHVPRMESREQCHLVTVFVFSAPGNFPKRDFIRITWGEHQMATQFGILPLFVVGISSKTPVYHQVMEEVKMHDDILMVDFLDTYDNLTLKSVSALKFLVEYGIVSLFILKMDDDVLLNPLNLRDFLLYYLSLHPKPQRLIGNLRKHSPVVRTGKNSVPSHVYHHKEYPPFLSGPAYIIPTLLLSQLLRGLQGIRMFPNEDVVVTGLAAEAVGIEHEDITSLFSRNPGDYLRSWATGPKVFQEYLSLSSMRAAWQGFLAHYNSTVSKPRRAHSLFRS